MLSRNSSCISSLFYIKPQLQGVVRLQRPVVYLLFSTSNHNQCPHQSITYWLYIFSFLHQTTTSSLFWICSLSCISSLFYIKPQLMDGIPEHAGVVYLLFSTSNHNPQGRTGFSCVLYIFSFLHQTTTCSLRFGSSSALYIFSFLHQTTTMQTLYAIVNCCISSLFYIKPQLMRCFFVTAVVVYLLFSTSNHNREGAVKSPRLVVYLLFSTSNHNQTYDRAVQVTVVYLLFSTSNHNTLAGIKSSIVLYIFSFLHQTTTSRLQPYSLPSCISSLFYIKPQRF